MKKLQSLSLTASAAALLPLVPAFGREPSQIQYPAGPVPTGPITAGFMNQPGTNPFYGLNSSGGKNGALPGMPAQNAVPGQGGGNLPVGAGANNIIQQILSTRVPAGTVLTGTLNDDLNSGKSEVGDLFSIVLTDGYFLNGIEAIPRNARIVGTVVSVSHSGTRGGVGMPGALEIGLTTLVYPDGRSMPFSGHLDHNPASIQKKPPKVVGSGFGMSGYGQQVKSMFNSFGMNSGYMRSITNRGPEFNVKKGTLVPVRLNRTLDLTKLVAPVIPPSSSPFGPAPDASRTVSGGNVPGTAPSGMPGGMQADPTKLQFPPTQSGAPLLPKELPEPF